MAWVPDKVLILNSFRLVSPQILFLWQGGDGGAKSSP
jgi:hypothetical protein